jgi:hypothetical protein
VEAERAGRRHPPDRPSAEHALPVRAGGHVDVVGRGRHVDGVDAAAEVVPAGLLRPRARLEATGALALGTSSYLIEARTST